VVTFKGLELGVRYRPAHGFYAAADVDLLVPKSGLPRAAQVLYEQGYTHRKYSHEAQEWLEVAADDVAAFNAHAYELMQFMKATRVEGLDADCLAAMSELPGRFSVCEGAVFAAVCFDVHSNLLFNIDVGPHWERSVVSALGIGRTFCAADHLWFLIHRYYFEVATGALSELRVLAPIAAMIGDPEIDWALLVRNAVEFNATAPLYYWLTFFHRLGAPGVSMDVLRELRSHQGRSQRDWGWQLARLLHVVETFPADYLA
jgi:hypothetical protein